MSFILLLGSVEIKGIFLAADDADRADQHGSESLFCFIASSDVDIVSYFVQFEVITSSPDLSPLAVRSGTVEPGIGRASSMVRPATGSLKNFGSFYRINSPFALTKTY